MSKKLKGIMIALILVMLLLQIVPDFIPDIAAGAAEVSDNATNPTVLRTIFGLWWVPLILLLIPVFMNSGAGKRLRARFGRRRRR